MATTTTTWALLYSRRPLAQTAAQEGRPCQHRVVIRDLRAHVLYLITAHKLRTANARRPLSRLPLDSLKAHFSAVIMKSFLLLALFAGSASLAVAEEHVHSTSPFAVRRPAPPYRRGRKPVNLYVGL